jgi:drug/metabolite transporter (DMT)-like permease
MLLLFNLPIVLKSDYSKISPSSNNFMLLRHLFLITFGIYFAQSFFYLPVNIAHTLSCTGPIFVLFLDYAFNKIEISKRQAYGVVLGFIGVVFVVNGHLIYKFFYPEADFHTKFEHYRPEAMNPYYQLLYSVILVAVCLFWAGSIVLVKRIKQVNHYQLNFQLGAFLVIAGGFLYPQTVINQEFRLSSFINSLLFQGLPLAAAQAFYSYAIMTTKNLGVLTVMNFGNVFLSYFLKIFRYD